MDDAPAELRKRAEAAEGFVALLTEQLRQAEQRHEEAQTLAREQQAQIRQLTALVQGMQQQLQTALQDLHQALAELAKKKKRKKGEPDEPADPEEPVEPVTTPAAPGPVVDPPPERGPDAALPPQEAPPKRKPKRNKTLLAHLPRHVVALDVHSCATCGGIDLAPVGEGEVSERYDYVPAQVRVERLERATCRCRTCGAFSTAPLPPVPVPGGSMTAALLAHIAYSKCCLHLPLDRIAEDLGRLGLPLAESTMCDAMGHTATLLEPVCDGIISDLFASGLLHLDGTGVKVLMPKEKGSYRGQFTVLSNAEATAYVFSETKSGEHLAAFLRVGTNRAYQGYLVADAASNMNLLYKDGKIIECGCWYHARETFVEARPSAPYEAAEGIAWISALFSVEHEADAAKDSTEQRKVRRQRDAVAVLDGFVKWMDQTQPRFEPADELYKAIQYCKNHKKALWRFLLDGRIPLTNNQAERDLGPIGRGRKAWLFAGSKNGGERLAKIYTVLGTCLRLSVDPRRYLTDVLPRLSTMPANRGRGLLQRLLPKAWKQAQGTPGPDPPTRSPVEASPS